MNKPITDTSKLDLVERCPHCSGVGFVMANFIGKMLAARVPKPCLLCKGSGLLKPTEKDS